MSKEILDNLKGILVINEKGDTKEVPVHWISNKKFKNQMFYGLSITFPSINVFPKSRTFSAPAVIGNKLIISTYQLSSWGYLMEEQNQILEQLFHKYCKEFQVLDAKLKEHTNGYQTIYQWKLSLQTVRDNHANRKVD